MSGKQVAFVIPPPVTGHGPAVRDLLHGCWCSGKRVGGIMFPPVTLAGFAAAAAERGFSPRVMDCPAERISFAKAATELRDAFAVVVMSSYFTSRDDTAFLSALASGGNRSRRVLIGPFPTFQPDIALRAESVDAVVSSEPDIALADLLAFLDGGGPPSAPPAGTRVKTREGILSGPPGGPVEDLDALPFPDRRLILRPGAYRNPAVRRMPFTTVFSSRGCASGCYFCPAPAFSLRRVRCRAVEPVLDEVRSAARLGYREIFFRDENFAADRDRLLRLCEGLSRTAPPIPWICSSRADHLDGETVRAMKRAGCHMVRIGVESGNQSILDRNRKGTGLERFRETFRACRAAGMETHAHFMIGMPGETRETVLDTLAFIGEIAPTLLTVGICTPIPGSSLFDALAGERPEFRESVHESGEIHASAPWNHLYCSVPGEALARLQRKAYRDFYGNPARWAGFLGGMFGGGGTASSRARSALDVLSFIRGRAG